MNEMSSRGVQSARAHPRLLALLLALLSMIGPFTIDAFFPAFQAVQRDLHTSPWLMQQTLSVYLITWGLMSLVHGPVSDRFGRRAPILFWLGVYSLASLGCAFADSIESLLLFRGLQGMAAGAGAIVGRALTRDLFEGPAAQKVFAMTSFFFGVAPALAPIIGGVLFEQFGWHSIFLFLVGYGLLLMLLVWRYLPESHPPAARISLQPTMLWQGYRRIGGDFGFVCLGLASGFNFNAQFLYIASTPFFVREILQLGTAGFAWFFVPMITGMMAGALLADRMANRWLPEQSIRYAYRIMLVAALLNVGYNALITEPSVPWAVLPILLNAFGTALGFPAFSFMMIDRHHDRRGAAASLQGFIWAAVAVVVAGVISPLVSRTGLTLALGAVSMTFLGWIGWRLYMAYGRMVVADADAIEAKTGKLRTPT